MSANGNWTLVVIVLLGNPFSPSYARARSCGGARALDHCSLHVALAGPREAWWSLRERAIDDGARRADELVLGTSRVAWRGGGLVIDVDERTTPGARPIRGQIRVRPEIETELSMALDAAREHTWWPVAPLAYVDVALGEPAIHFDGRGYHDANAGVTPLEDSFRRWSWSRTTLSKGRAAVGYDVVDRAGRTAARTLLFERGGAQQVDNVGRARLPRTAWALHRAVKSDSGDAVVEQSLLDSPFYARARVVTRLFGEEVTAMHEVLSAERLQRAWVRLLVGYRMGRA